MVVRQLDVALDPTTISTATVATPILSKDNMPIKSMTVHNETSKNLSKQNTTISMPRKYVSMSPARVPRSKSMNGLSRIDANKINENGTTNHVAGHSYRSLKRNGDTGSLDNSHINNNHYTNGMDNSSSNGWKTTNKRNNE